MSEHTPGQLKVGHRGYIYASKSGKGIDEPVVAEPRHSISISASERKANASHLVACWNACEGINPEAVLRLLEAARWIQESIDMEGRAVHYDKIGRSNLRTAIARMEGS